MDTRLLNFQKRLHDLAPTDAERAKVFGVCRDTIIDWKRGKSLRTIIVLMNDPDTLRALADDAEAGLRASHGDTKESAA